MPGPHPSVAAGRNAVKTRLMAAGASVPKQPLVLVACSGGADSLALAAAAAFVGPRCLPPWQVGAVVVDHGWFEGSDLVASKVAQQCTALGLDPVIVRRVSPDEQGSAEAAARTARYAAFAEVAADLQATKVLLGHTMNDQAETVLWGLTRGSGLAAVAGMPAQRGIYDRPFLGLSRAQTEQMCGALGLSPWQDPSNSDTRFTRVKIRREVLPVLTQQLGNGVVPALARTARHVAADLDYLDDVARSTLAQCVQKSAALTSLPVADLVDLHSAIRHRVLAKALTHAGVPPDRLLTTHVQAADALIMAWRGQRPANVPGGLLVWRDKGQLHIGPEQPDDL